MSNDNYIQKFEALRDKMWSYNDDPEGEYWAFLHHNKLISDADYDEMDNNKHFYEVFYDNPEWKESMERDYNVKLTQEQLIHLTKIWKKIETYMDGAATCSSMISFLEDSKDGIPYDNMLTELKTYDSEVLLEFFDD